MYKSSFRILCVRDTFGICSHLNEYRIYFRMDEIIYFNRTTQLTFNNRQKSIIYNTKWSEPKHKLNYSIILPKIKITNFEYDCSVTYNQNLLHFNVDPQHLERYRGSWSNLLKFTNMTNKTTYRKLKELYIIYDSVGRNYTIESINFVDYYKLNIDSFPSLEKLYLENYSREDIEKLCNLINNNKFPKLFGLYLGRQHEHERLQYNKDIYDNVFSLNSIVDLQIDYYTNFEKFDYIYPNKPLPNLKNFRITSTINLSKINFNNLPNLQKFDMPESTPNHNLASRKLLEDGKKYFSNTPIENGIEITMPKIPYCNHDVYNFQRKFIWEDDTYASVKKCYIKRDDLLMITKPNTIKKKLK